MTAVSAPATAAEGAARAVVEVSLSDEVTDVGDDAPV